MVPVVFRTERRYGEDSGNNEADHEFVRIVKDLRREDGYADHFGARTEAENGAVAAALSRTGSREGRQKWRPLTSRSSLSQNFIVDDDACV